MPLEPKPAQFPAIRSALKFYKVTSIITGVMLLLLVVEMIVKYGLHLELFAFGPQGLLHLSPMYLDPSTQEWVSGGAGANVSTGILIAHGWFYVVYLFADFRLWSLMRWPFSKFVLIALGGVIPTLSFFVEVRIVRQVKEYLAAREQAGAVAAPTIPSPTTSPSNAEASH